MIARGKKNHHHCHYIVKQRSKEEGVKNKIDQKNTKAKNKKKTINKSEPKSSNISTWWGGLWCRCRHLVVFCDMLLQFLFQFWFFPANFHFQLFFFLKFEANCSLLSSHWSLEKKLFGLRCSDMWYWPRLTWMPTGRDDTVIKEERGTWRSIE